MEMGKCRLTKLRRKGTYFWEDFVSEGWPDQTSRAGRRRLVQVSATPQIDSVLFFDRAFPNTDIVLH